MMRILINMLLFSFSFFSCARHKAAVEPTNPPVSAPVVIDILALGDSYTKGENIISSQNFPNQLADSLATTIRPRIIAQTGWRTDQLKTAIAAAPELKDSVFSIVTLCIGVNNQYQNIDIQKFKTEFEQLLQIALERAGNRADRVFVLSIPDWAFTEYGQQYSSNPAAISTKIDEYNAFKKAITEQYNVKFINITEISRQGLVRPELVASDGLHPSALQYTEWLQLLLPAVRTALDN